MELSIVVRASDPARAASILAALGIYVDPPNRANPGAWTVKEKVSIVVTAASDGDPGIELGVKDHGRVISALSAIVGGEGVTATGHVERVVVDAGDGIRLTIAADAPWRQWHDVRDAGYSWRILPLLEMHKERIHAAIKASGASNPRLAGANLARLPKRGRWLLVVDAPANANLAPLDDVLRDLATIGNWDVVDACRADQIDPDILRRIDVQAYDI